MAADPDLAAAADGDERGEGSGVEVASVRDGGGGGASVVVRASAHGARARADDRPDADDEDVEGGADVEAGAADDAPDVHDADDPDETGLRRRKSAGPLLRRVLSAAVPPQTQGPMHTVSYERYDSEVWNDRKRAVAGRTTLRRRRRRRRDGGEVGEGDRSPGEEGGEDRGEPGGSEGGDESAEEDEKDDENCDKRAKRHQRLNQLYLRSAVLFVGFVTASAGFAVERVSTSLMKAMTTYVPLGASPTPQNFGTYLGFALLYGLVALLPVAFFRPVAAGSGIAEAKAVLNGIQIPRCTQMWSALVKGVSVAFGEASALPVGLEGPLIFIGMALGENAYRIIPRNRPELRSWRMRRDLAAVGTAAGVAVAFLSPIGGILFAAEEGASYFDAHLLNLCFGAAITVVIVDYFYSVVAEAGADGLSFSEPFPAALSRFNGHLGHEYGLSLNDLSPPKFSFVDYFVVVLVGACGGVVGACWVEASKALSRMRQKYVRTAGRKVVEIVVLSTVAASLTAWLPTVPRISTCRSLDNIILDQNLFARANCGENEYNDLATLLRNPLANAMNLLFWEEKSAFSAVSCVVAGTTILLLLLITFGASIAMGIFVPLMYCGAAFGRAFSMVSSDRFDVSLYAVIGAAASLNGVVRVLVSVTVILVETTNVTSFVSPLMIVCLVSRWVGNALFRKEGIYDEVLKLRGIPFLEAEPPEITKREVLRARDIMSKEWVELGPVMLASDIVSILKKHNQYLDYIVTDNHGRLMGSIRRSSLVAILMNKKTWSREGNISYHGRDRVSYDDLDYDQAESVTNDELSHLFDDDDKDCQDHFLNIAYFMSIARITFAESGSAERACELVGMIAKLLSISLLTEQPSLDELFRTHGLRQLIVLNEKEPKPAGILTRQVFLNAFEEGGEVGRKYSSQSLEDTHDNLERQGTNFTYS